jgi:hypothetical protein
MTGSHGLELGYTYRSLKAAPTGPPDSDELAQHVGLAEMVAKPLVAAGLSLRTHTAA